jgi:hypothetical protein
MKENLKSEVCELLIFAVAAGCCVLFTVCSPYVKEGVIGACERCLNVIIPSLFIFAALSSMILSSGAYKALSKPFYPLAKYIFAMPCELFFVFLLGSISGYPIGIKLLSDMVRQGSIDKKTAECLSAFCYCGGPAFYAGAVGLTVFGSTKIGMLIFLSVTVANIIVGAVLCRIMKPTFQTSKVRYNFSADILSESVLSGGRTMFTVCVPIVFFGGIIACIDGIGAFDSLLLTSADGNASVLVKSLLEISFISDLAGRPYRLLPYVAACCSFGGLCVISQVAALCRGSFSLKFFLAARPLCALLSAVICRLLSGYFLPTTVDVIAFDGEILVNFNNFTPSICLILMILLLNFKKRLVIYKRI